MYVACLECGQEFDYDWKEMEMGDKRAPLWKTVEEQTHAHYLVCLDRGMCTTCHAWETHMLQEGRRHRAMRCGTVLTAVVLASFGLFWLLLGK